MFGSFAQYMSVYLATDSLELELRIVGRHHLVLALNLCPLEEYQELLTLEQVSDLSRSILADRACHSLTTWGTLRC